MAAIAGIFQGERASRPFRDRASQNRRAFGLKTKEADKERAKEKARQKLPEKLNYGGEKEITKAERAL